MLCEKCQKNQATVHMQQFVNGAKSEIHLCQACSLSLAEMPVSFEHLFQGVLDSLLSMTADAKTSKKASMPALKCEACGMTYEQFKACGKLGCEACYRTFSNELETLLKNVQGGSVRHEGKFPKRSGVALRQKREVDRLRVLLKKAVDDENFEEAAQLRDRIKVMEVSAV
ncbi:MAG: UvrB/UvrC motif-containing protein [Clostridiales bacterium]|jgi:protein arginine kinase activator|nr:UvrB/UvrC motif-containing protein [Clostridiales bacterium]